jgi:uncharacterized protein (DUF433 family)
VRLPTRKQQFHALQSKRGTAACAARKEGTPMVDSLTQREADVLITQHIGPHPSNPGRDEYWLVEPGVPVWAVIGAYQAEEGDVEAVAAAYHLSREQVDAALAYYDRHRSLIDNRLAQNHAA